MNRGSAHVGECQTLAPARLDRAGDVGAVAQARIPIHRLPGGLARRRDEARVANQVGDAQIGDAAVLARAEELSGTADPQVRIGNVEAVVGLEDGGQARLAVGRRSARDQDAGPPFLAAADPPALTIRFGSAGHNPLDAINDHHHRRELQETIARLREHVRDLPRELQPELALSCRLATDNVRDLPEVVRAAAKLGLDEVHAYHAPIDDGYEAYVEVARQSIAQALTEPPCLVPQRNEPLGEAISWKLDGSGYLTVSEKKFQPVYLFAQPAS